MKFKKGDKVKLKNYSLHSDYSDHRGQVGTIIRKASLYDWRVQWSDSEESNVEEENMELVKTKPRPSQFAVEVRNEEESAAVQRKALSEGWGWIYSGKEVKYTKEEIIHFGDPENKFLTHGDKESYLRYRKNEYPLISASEYLGDAKAKEHVNPEVKEGDKVKVHKAHCESFVGKVAKVLRTNEDGSIQAWNLDESDNCTHITKWEKVEEKAEPERETYHSGRKIDPSELQFEPHKMFYSGAAGLHRFSAWREPITNSPKGVFKTMLKKVTTFIRGLQEPTKSYVRLGWLEIEDNEYAVTEVGVEALQKVQFGLTGDEKTLSQFAQAEVKRLEADEKKKK